MNGAIYLVLWNLVPLALSYRFSAVSSWGNLGRSSGLENPYGSPDYYSPLTPPYGMFTKSMELIQRQSRKQAMIMAENALSTEDDCMHREFCRIGAFEVDDRPGEFEAVIATLKMLANMDEEFGSDNEIPHMAKIMTAYHVGVISKDKALCNHVFTCKVPLVEGRSTCKAVSKVCPALSITCGLCAIVSPHTCAAVCPVTAIYCGASGFVCSAEAPTTTTTPPTTTTAPTPTTGSTRIKIERPTEAPSQFIPLPISPRSFDPETQSSLLKMPRYPNWF